jgi:hypothetical protein
MSLSSEQHANDFPLTSHDIVGKKKSRAKFPCMLCKGCHIIHLCPRMDKASKLLEDMIVSQPQLPVAYHKISLNPLVVDGMINLVPPSVRLIDQVVNLVTSLIELVDKVVDPIPSSVDPTLPLESVNKVVDLIPSSVDPTLPLESVNKVVDLIPSLVDPTLPLESETQVVNLFPPVDPILPLENETQVVDLISPSVDPTLPLESKPDTAHVFLVDTESTMPGAIPPPVEPPPSYEAIHFDWGVLTRPHFPSHIPFQITVQVCGRDVPQTRIDECASVSILSSFAWQALGCPPLAPVT